MIFGVSKYCVLFGEKKKDFAAFFFNYLFYWKLKEHLETWNSEHLKKIS